MEGRCCKAKDELVLKDWLDAVVIPDADRQTVKPFVSEELKPKEQYLCNEGKDIWEWSEEVYEYVRETAGKENGLQSENL